MIELDKLSDKEKRRIRKQEKKKQSKFSKRIVALVIFLNVIFTAAVLYIFLRVASEPTTLIISWFAFTTGELWMLSSIKKKEVKKEVDLSD